MQAEDGRSKRRTKRGNVKVSKRGDRKRTKRGQKGLRGDGQIVEEGGQIVTRTGEPPRTNKPSEITTKRRQPAIIETKHNTKKRDEAWGGLLSNTCKQRQP